MANAFVERLDLCTAQPGFCQRASDPADPLGQGTSVDINAPLRQELAKTIQLRAAALTALGQAYAALKQEADYDARADMTDAVNEAVTNTNSFATAAFTLAKAPIPVDIGKLVGAAGGLIAEKRQKGRILAANAKLREITQRLHDAMKAEAQIYDIIASPIAINRSRVTLFLYDEGLLDGGQLIKPVLDALEVPSPPGIAAKIASNPALKAAVREGLRASQEIETVRARARYRASLAALQALLVEHDNLAEQRSVSLTDVVRLLAEVNALLENPATPAKAGNK
ncbi:MAG: hypothetical protein ACOYO0_07270 [Sandarakinorhabdus sp.]